MTAGEDILGPVRKSVRVERSAEEAFRLFTEHIDRWWPVEVFSRAADGTSARATAQPDVDRMATRRMLEVDVVR